MLLVSTARRSIMSGGIGIKNPLPARMDDFQAEFGLYGRGEPLARSGEDDQPLAVGKRQKLINIVQVMLR